MKELKYYFEKISKFENRNFANMHPQSQNVASFCVFLTAQQNPMPDDFINISLGTGSREIFHLREHPWQMMLLNLCNIGQLFFA